MQSEDRYICKSACLTDLSEKMREIIKKLLVLPSCKARQVQISWSHPCSASILLSITSVYAHISILLPTRSVTFTLRGLHAHFCWK